MTERLLTMADVAMSYPRVGGGRIDLFDGISVAVVGGTVTAIAGRSGSGKTTLLNIAGGLMPPTKGTVCWRGEAVDSLEENERRQLRGSTIGFVFQGGGLINALTAAENVAVPGLPVGVDRNGSARAVDLLDQVGLRARARHFPFQLSAGEQQRVGIARALFRNPPILILDEPTANLDRITAAAIVELVRRLASSGRGLMVATHDATLVHAANQVVELEPRG
jgi:ABC-type lipoprotein export system ATPase subunit